MNTKKMVENILCLAQNALAEIGEHTNVHKKLKMTNNAAQFLQVDSSGLSSALILKNMIYDLLRTGYSLETLSKEPNYLKLLTQTEAFFQQVEGPAFEEHLRNVSDHTKDSLVSIGITPPNDIISSIKTAHLNLPFYINNSEHALIKEGKPMAQGRCKFSPIVTKFRTAIELLSFIENQSDGVHLCLLRDTKDNSNNAIAFTNPVFAIKNNTQISILYNHESSGSDLPISDVIALANNRDKTASDNQSIATVDPESQHIICHIKEVSSDSQITLIIMANYISNNLFATELSEDCALKIMTAKTTGKEIATILTASLPPLTFNDITYLDDESLAPIHWMEKAYIGKDDVHIINQTHSISDDASIHAYKQFSIDGDLISIKNALREGAWLSKRNVCLSMTENHFGSETLLKNKQRQIALFNKAVVIQMRANQDYKDNKTALQNELVTVLKQHPPSYWLEKISAINANKMEEGELYNTLRKETGAKLSSMFRGHMGDYESDCAFFVSITGETSTDILKGNGNGLCYLGKHKLSNFLSFRLHSPSQFDAIFDVSKLDPATSYLARVRVALVEIELRATKDITTADRLYGLHDVPDNGGIESRIINPWAQKPIKLLVPVTKKQLNELVEKKVVRGE